MTAAVSHTNHTKTVVDAANNNKLDSTAANIASQDVGLLFVREYYTFLNKKPLRLHAFYNKDSFFVRGDEGETVQTYQGQDEIRKKIEELNFEDCKVLVTQVDSQASANNGIIIQVLGEMCVMDGPSQKFSQTFFLAPQPNGYYVLNDIFRFLKDEVDIDYYTCEDDQQQQTKKDEVIVEQQAVAEDGKQQPSEPVKEPVRQVEQTTVPVVEESVKATSPVESKPEEKKKKQTKEDAKTMTNGVTDVKKTEKPKQSQPSKTTEKPATPTSTAASPAPPAPAAPRSWANLAANDPSKWGAQVSEAKGSVAANAPAATQQTTKETSQQTTKESTGSQQQTAQSNKDRKEEATSIFVKNVTHGLTEAQLSEAFSKFGTVKSLNIVASRQCAFLDFTTPEACQKALGQHKVNVGTSIVLAEERRRYGSGGMNRQQQQNGTGGNYERRHQSNYRRSGNTNTNSNTNTGRTTGNTGNTNKSRPTGNPQK
ncbi:uncharacterized protein BX664DRAFT_323490 [Halteromyces radiatus]|uniref:uncharacterized protein n=1 Tax=Halteromyces radiatus TaxID=101107 RepID=UPI00221FF60B|nr:uncharacterized protein BX664DRAFT_323490 [Halteromyces radiatus]KAI8096261.1 hypothetical protein BX664DRAFT_323490 [Halteromyces radiatus]